MVQGNGSRFFSVWWSFLWRYGLVSTSLLLAGGRILTYCFETCSPLMRLAVLGAFGASVKALTAYGVCYRIQGSSRTRGEKLRFSFAFLWRFLLFTLFSAILVGAALPRLAAMGIRIPYPGELAVIPGSGLALLTFLWRNRLPQPLHSIVVIADHKENDR